MGQRTAPESTRGPRRRGWIASVALAAAIALAVALPVIAQELDPLDAMRAEFDACIASGAEGSICAAEAKSHLDAIMSGDSASSGAPTEPASEGSLAGVQTSSAGGEDGQVSRGGEETLASDTAVDTSEVPAPAPASEATPAPTAAPPPVDAAPADGTASTTATTGTDPGHTTTLSGGSQTDDASGTDGGRLRQ